MNLSPILSILLPISLVFWLITIFNSSKEVTQLPSPLRWLLSTSIPLLLGFRAFEKKSLSLSGSLLGVVTGFVLTLSNYCFCGSLFAFFISSSKATKYKSEQKSRFEPDFKEGGQRNWVQVVCNGGVATYMALFYLMEKGCGETPINFINEYNISWFAISVLGSICCANGDTLASELGSVLAKGNPYLITSLKRVPKGTNGGVSFIGLIVSALGGMTVSIGFLLVLYICANTQDYKLSPSQFYPLLIVGLFGGLFGSLIDSLLGATLQYSGFDEKSQKIVEYPGPYVTHISGVRLLDNNSVNLLSNLMTALVTPYFAIYLWHYF